MCNRLGNKHADDATVTMHTESPEEGPLNVLISSRTLRKDGCIAVSLTSGFRQAIF